MSLLGHRSVLKRPLCSRLLFVCALVYTLCLTVASLWRFIAFNPIPIRHGDKYAHSVAYLGFGLIWFGYFYFSGRYGFAKGLTMSALGGVVYGLLMEVAQGLFTDYRMPEFLDVLANSFGIVLAVMMILLGKPILLKIKSKGLR